MLIDFLQKKVVDKWMRRFLVISAYLFSERVLFKFIVRFYIDFVVWPATRKTLFELSNVSFLVSLTLGSILILVIAFNLSYLYILYL